MRILYIKNTDASVTITTWDQLEKTISSPVIAYDQQRKEYRYFFTTPDNKNFYYINVTKTDDGKINLENTYHIADAELPGSFVPVPFTLDLAFQNIAVNKDNAFFTPEELIQLDEKSQKENRPRSDSQDSETIDLEIKTEVSALLAKRVLFATDVETVNAIHPNPRKFFKLIQTDSSVLLNKAHTFQPTLLEQNFQKAKNLFSKLNMPSAVLYLVAMYFSYDGSEIRAEEIFSNCCTYQDGINALHRRAKHSQAGNATDTTLRQCDKTFAGIAATTAAFKIQR